MDNEKAAAPVFMFAITIVAAIVTMFFAIDAESIVSLFFVFFAFIGAGVLGVYLARQHEVEEGD